MAERVVTSGSTLELKRKGQAFAWPFQVNAREPIPGGPGRWVGTSRDGPEPCECPALGRLAQFLEGPLADLADPLAGDAHQRTDLLERHRLGAAVEPVVQVQNLAFAWRQVALEHPINRLAHQLDVGRFLDFRAVGAGEPFAERAGFAVASVHR